MKASLRQRLILALAALILLPVFVTPVWTIRLVAPQYSDGLGMYIGVSEVWGHEEHDIQNINILNHYIGMKPIEPEGIPELDIFPPILAGIIVMGLVAAAIGRRWAMTGWLAGFVALGIAGMVDFYLWMIDYGHNLDPMAAIKIPGMTYTPPLIGTKELLNITASSWPHIGSLFIGVSIALGAWAVIGMWRKRNTAEPSPSEPGGDGAAELKQVDLARPTAAAALAVSGIFLVAACGTPQSTSADSASPQLDGDRIVYGESVDPYCGEMVERVRWGGEVRTAGAETLRFRSVECMAAYVLEAGLSQDDVVEIKAVDFPDGWRLVDVKDAFFLHTPNLASPAARKLNVMAISTEKMAHSLQRAYTGPLLEWDEVLAVVAEEWQIGSFASAMSRDRNATVQ